MEGRISRQLLAKVVDFEQDMKIQVLDVTPCLCASGSGAYTTTRTDGRTERKALQLFTTFTVITALKYNKHPSLDTAVDIFWCFQYLHTVSYSRHLCYACNFPFKFVT